ncbi:RNA polymerase sigma factor SigJ [Gordonia sp. LSe1-13]|uniref:RNA polymerase sigma factor SigJ n=1 Tax=Gordonia sesuvii TaxID=3116777 RepID=A0ABU7MCL9_9ACTN|nr:RNA polymerase sigma factor SigJ [Gordonia sp. LSe1-13]
MSEASATDHDRVFTELRPLLFTVAYDILGSATDAEDVIHDCYLRWRAQDAGPIADPRAYLVTAVSRTGLNHLRTLRRRRETYVGNWLPEPIRTEPHRGTGDAADDVVLAESVSMAMLLVLETLSPVERTVFVLHEVFDYPHDEIAAIVDRSPATVRQIAHRARGHISARRPRAAARRPGNHDDRDRQEHELVVRFLHASRTGDLGELLSVLASDVVHMSDGGGQVTAARHALYGADRVAAFSIGLARSAMSGAHAELARFNEAPAAVFRVDDVVDSVAVFDCRDDHIVGVYAIRNPDKLHRIDDLHRLDRGRTSPWKP